MSVSLYWRFQVENFDTWLNPDADGLALMFKEQGVSAYSLARNLATPRTAGCRR